MESYSSIFTTSQSERGPTTDTASAEQADAFQYHTFSLDVRHETRWGESRGTTARGGISVRAGDLQERFTQIKEQIKVGKIKRNKVHIQKLGT